MLIYEVKIAFELELALSGEGLSWINMTMVILNFEECERSLSEISKSLKKLFGFLSRKLYNI